MKKPIGFKLIKTYPGCNKPLGYVEPYTTGEFFKYPEFWMPQYNIDRCDSLQDDTPSPLREFLNLDELAGLHELYGERYDSVLFPFLPVHVLTDLFDIMQSCGTIFPAGYYEKGNPCRYKTSAVYGKLAKRANDRRLNMVRA